MYLLLKAALRNRRHFTLLIMTFMTLFVLTIANQLEMFSLGILSNTGSDFFTLFSLRKTRSMQSPSKTSSLNGRKLIRPAQA